MSGLVQIESPRGAAAAESAGDVCPPGRPILELAARAIRDFGLIRPGARVAVAVSGGKDSLLLAVVLRALARRADLDFSWRLVHLDQHQPGFQRDAFDAALARLGFECEVVRRDTWSVVSSKLAPGQIPCALCSRMRRGILNGWCVEHGFDTLALGHHLDDAVETFFLNLLYGRRLDPLKPVTPDRDGAVRTIRPLILVEERRVEAWVERHGLRPVPCPVCDSYPDSKRRDLKQLVSQFRAMQPEVDASVREALYGR